MWDITRSWCICRHNKNGGGGVFGGGMMVYGKRERRRRQCQTRVNHEPVTVNSIAALVGGLLVLHGIKGRDDDPGLAHLLNSSKSWTDWPETMVQI